MAVKKNVPEIRFKGFEGEWVENSLGVMAETFEYGLNAAATTYDGVNKYIRITDIDDDTREFKIDVLTSPDTNLSIADNYKLKEGDLLFARTGASVGKTYYYKASDGLVYYAGFLIRARIKPEFDINFVFQNTLTYKYNNFIRLTSQRSGQPGVNAQEYSLFKIITPKTSEQSHIGTYFQNLDKLITLHQAKYNKLANIKKAMLEKMFPKNGADVPEIRFKGFDGKWEECSLAEITFSSGIKNSDNLSFESYSISNVNGFVPQEEQFEHGGTMRDADKSMYYIVSPQSFAYNPARINVGSIGYQNLSKSVIVSSLYDVFKTTDKCVDGFLWCWIKTAAFQKLIEQYQEGGVRLYFYYDKFCKGKIYLPSVEEQTKIGNYFQNIDKLISLHQQELDKLKNIKKACLEKMFV